ncbi:putative outer membrane starch-binding protein [Jejuia pallidilutea]|uniref:Putative outer membrane starch-binding protein n=1 Tax=Jejuia pallidilutea TaxID=504487 RepID=A0A362X3P9_9FLAO|nr:RagB/SusD family nutrient uptake outer membrane protein [Jejuia pallidilutea]PQV51525.1 putative outer membrane starch-binding protein [Jejuia pallidilutea]
MKKIIFLLIAIAFTGCSDDFLDRDSLTAISESNFWKTEKDAQLGLNGIYDVLQDPIMYGGSLNGLHGTAVFDVFSDNSYNFYKGNGPGFYMEGNIDPNHFYFNFYWTACYRGIGRANVALENIEAMPESVISQDKKDEYLAQALFLRSLFYTKIAIYFQNAPLVLNVQTLDEAYVPKNSYEEIKDQIIADLIKAASALPVRYPENQYGYATKGAALGLLARFYMYNKEYQKALDATTEILGLGYSLNPSYAQLFTEQGEFSNEIIFSVRFVEGVSDNTENFSATFSGIPKVDDQPMPNLVDDYYNIDGLPISVSPLFNPAKEQENRDPRLNASVYFKGDIFLVDINRPFRGNTATTYARKKYIRNANYPNGTRASRPGGQDFIVMRYAEVLLMRAEALVELNQLSEVSALVNQVRARVNMPTVESVEGTGLSQDELRDIVRHERRVELAMEGLRFFDLKRWGEVEQAYQRLIADNVPGYNPSYRGVKSETFPIPQNEIDANNNLTQNTGWE